jgi:hypothetical protein
MKKNGEIAPNWILGSLYMILIVNLALKVYNIIDWPWWKVLWPLWSILIITIIALIALGIIKIMDDDI